MRVGDGERITALGVAGGEVTFEIASLVFIVPFGAEAEHRFAMKATVPHLSIIFESKTQPYRSRVRSHIGVLNTNPCEP
jgi:hypothetical protein